MNFVLNGLRTCVKRQDKKTKHKWSPIQVSCHQSQKDLEVKTGQPAQTWQWLMADGKGTLTAVPTDPSDLAIQCGLAQRDLQLLEPHAVFPCSMLVLVRKQALLLALDGLHMVICCDHLYIVSAPDPAQPAKHQAPTSDNFAVRALLKQLRCWASRVAASTTADEQSVQDPESLPFELHMLEAALELAFGWLAAEAAVLERSAQPLITGLASKVTHEGLRALHHLKLSLSGLTARVAKLQQALEGLRHDRRALAALCMLGAPVSRNRTSVQRMSGARPGHGPTGSPTPAKPVQQAQACGGGTSSPTLAQSLGSSPGGRQGQLGSPPGSPQRQASQQLDVKLVDACRALLECYSLQAARMHQSLGLMRQAASDGNQTLRQQARLQPCSRYSHAHLRL